MRATGWPWLAWPAVVLALASCGSDGSSSSNTTTEVVRSVQLEGTDGPDSWTLGMHPDGDGFCLSLSFDPPMRNPIVVGQAASLRSAPSASVRGDICLGQQLDADPEAVSFQPVFAPFIYEEPDYRRQVIGGVVSSETRDLQLELASGDTAPIELRDGGLFIAFPTEDVVALRMTLDGAVWRCEEGLASAFDLCQPT